MDIGFQFWSTIRQSVNQIHVVLPHRASAILCQGFLSTRTVSWTQNYRRSRLPFSTYGTLPSPPGTPKLHTTNFNLHDLYVEGGLHFELHMYSAISQSGRRVVIIGHLL
jgi:hypothetical protein